VRGVKEVPAIHAAVYVVQAAAQLRRCLQRLRPRGADPRPLGNAFASSGVAGEGTAGMCACGKAAFGRGVPGGEVFPLIGVSSSGAFGEGAAGNELSSSKACP